MHEHFGNLFNQSSVERHLDYFQYFDIKVFYHECNLEHPQFCTHSTVSVGKFAGGKL